MIPIVLSTQRVGSTWLFLHFHSTPKHVCFEPYNSDVPIYRSEYGEISKKAEYKKRHSDPVGYFRFLSQFGYIDIKLEIMPENVFAVICKNATMFRVVILKRKNLLKQYISYLAANRSKIFYSKKDVKESFFSVDIPSFEIYHKKIKRLYESAIKNISDAMHTDYEDIDVFKISDYFGIESQFKPDIIALHKDYSFISNREELNKKYPQWTI